MVAKISNIDDLRASLDLMAKEGICQPIAEEDGYSFTTLQKNSLLVFNENAAVLTEAYGTSQMDVAKQTISTLLKQTEENSIMKNSGFKRCKIKKGTLTSLLQWMLFLRYTHNKSVWDFLHNSI